MNRFALTLLLFVTLLLAGCSGFRLDGEVVERGDATASAQAQRSGEVTPSAPTSEAAPSATPPTSLSTLTPEAPTATPGNPATNGAPETRNLICLHVAAGAEIRAASEGLRGALEYLEQHHPDWGLAVRSPEGLVIAGECIVNLPDEPLGKATRIGPGIVVQPGPWHAVVAVVGEEQADQLLGSSTARVAVYEMMAEGHEAWTVTNAAVVRAGSFQTPETLRTLALALQLDPDRLTGSAAPPAPGGETISITATVREVPLSDGRVLSLVPTEEHAYAYVNVPVDVPITREDGQPATAADIQVGDVVRVIGVPTSPIGLDAVQVTILVAHPAEE